MEMKYDYDFIGDSLYIKKSGSKVKSSIEIGDEYVLDMGYDGRVIGVEIFNASKKFGLKRDILKKINRVNLVSKFSRNLLIVSISAYIPNIKIPQHTITLPRTISVSN